MNKKEKKQVEKIIEKKCFTKKQIGILFGSIFIGLFIIGLFFGMYGAFFNHYLCPDNFAFKDKIEINDTHLYECVEINSTEKTIINNSIVEYEKKGTMKVILEAKYIQPPLSIVVNIGYFCWIILILIAARRYVE